MNEIKRYDQALADQLEHLPMLPEDTAWAEMKKMLDKDDDDPVVVPWFRRPGCLLLGLVAALLLSIGGWLYFKRDTAPVPVSEQVSRVKDSTGNNSPVGSSNGIAQTNTVVENTDTISTTSNQTPAGTTQTSGLVSTTSFTTGEPKDQTGSGNKKLNASGRSAAKISAPGLNQENSGNKRTTTRRPGYSSANGTKTRAKVVAPVPASEEEPSESTSEANRNKQQQDPGKMTAAIQPGAMDSSITKTAARDSSRTIKKDSLPDKKTTTVNQPAKEKEEEQKKKYWQLAAGLSVYQPIPVDGESAVPYNRYGRKGSLTDYVPSAYLRLYRSRKWFLHTEFRYGAPQAVKPFDYKQQVRDSFQVLIRTVYQLRKTYYHQVPFSFNYFVLPNLSVGAGIIYNRFTGAVAQQNIYRSSAAAQDTLTSSSIVRDTADDRFVKNHFQWSAEAQYQWKRLSIGARYSSDLTPYIKFNALNNTGATVEKKMKALNVFIRYDLWRSKKWGK